jgi:intracellular septation protein
MKNLINLVPILLFIILYKLLPGETLLLPLSAMIVCSIGLMFFKKGKSSRSQEFTGTLLALLFLLLLISIQNTLLADLTIPLLYFLLASIFVLSLLTKKYIATELIFGNVLKQTKSEWQKMTWQWILFLLISGSAYLIVSLSSLIPISQWNKVRWITLLITFLVFICQQIFTYQKRIKQKISK